MRFTHSFRSNLVAVIVASGWPFLAALVPALATAAASALTWKVGDAVEAGHTHNWYRATIVAVGDGRWRVRYDGHPASEDQWKSADEIRPRPGVVTAGAAAPASGIERFDDPHPWVLARRSAASPNWTAARLIQMQGEPRVYFHGDPPSSARVLAADRVKPMPARNRPATAAEFFFGSWDLSIWGGINTVTRGHREYMTFGYSAAKAPPLTIRRDGSFEWMVAGRQPGERVRLEGRWRIPTPAEWRYPQLALLLEKGMDGKNWIVREDITYCTPKWDGEPLAGCTPDKVADKIKLWDGDLNYDGIRIK